MDWLDEVLEEFKVRVNNLSLKKALAVYIVLCILLVAAATVITQAVCSVWDNFIWSKYSMDETIEPGAGIASIQHFGELNNLDQVLVTIIELVQSWCTIPYSLLGILGLSYLFYNNKIKEPLNILKEAAVKVGKNDLEIDMYYNNLDEMGDLCRSFDLMRKQLISNNQKMWDMMEEQRRLNAAFAHDLRTPLTVLKGYTDLLKQYVPEGRISEDKLLSTLTLMSEHISRLENYSNTMKEISSLEELPLKPKPVTAALLEMKLRQITDVLDGKNKIHIKLFNQIFDYENILMLDESIVMEVFENLMSNAVRYAAKEIEVSLSLSEDGRQLLLTVADDGKGFTKTDLIMAAKAYYTEDKEHRTQHFGIGLYICKILCEKHKGALNLENRLHRGASITAVFTLC